MEEQCGICGGWLFLKPTSECVTAFTTEGVPVAGVWWSQTNVEVSRFCSLLTKDRSRTISQLASSCSGNFSPKSQAPISCTLTSPVPQVSCPTCTGLLVGWKEKSGESVLTMANWKGREEELPSVFPTSCGLFLWLLATLASFISFSGAGLGLLKELFVLRGGSFPVSGAWQWNGMGRSNRGSVPGVGGSLP